MRELAVRRLATLREERERFAADFPFYAAENLQIRTKAGSLAPLRLNRVQTIIHEALEAQKRETGRVRALILKARQPGVSTYVGGRYYHAVTHHSGARAFILTHKDSATDNLFAMAKRYHDHVPDRIRPATKANNAKELLFSKLDSGYQVGTAKAQGVGRSDTIQYFHGSEVAFWANADDHAAGALQAVPDEDGTEIVLESTANGVGGLFYNMCQAAIRGQGAYRLIFVPWFDHDEYEAEPPVGWAPPLAFADYQRAYKLSDAQIYWAWAKNAELATASGEPTDELSWRFKQEYPANAEEAFFASNTGSLIGSEAVLKARSWTAPEDNKSAVVLGVDCGRTVDRTRLIDRQARCAGGLVNETLETSDTMEVVGRIARLQDIHEFDQIFIDLGSFGAAIYDRLRELGYRKMLTGVNFGGKALDPRKYANKRAEMWGLLRDWLADEGGAELPDDDQLHVELTAPMYKFNSNQQMVLEPKEKVIERLGFSPDGADALALTFAFPVVRRDIRHHRRGLAPAKAGGYQPHRW